MLKTVVVLYFFLCAEECISSRVVRESAYPTRPNGTGTVYSIPKRPQNYSPNTENVYSIRVQSGDGIVMKSPSEYEYRNVTHVARPHGVANTNPYSIARPSGVVRDPPQILSDSYSLKPLSGSSDSFKPPSASDAYSPKPQNPVPQESFPPDKSGENLEGNSKRTEVRDMLEITIRHENIYNQENVYPSMEEKLTECHPSQTISNGEPACKGHLLFEDDFSVLNPQKWSNDITFPSKPDYEFVAFIQSENNTFVRRGVLHLKPTLTADLSPRNVVRVGKLILQGCTAPVHGGSCNIQASNFNILPPVLSSKLRSRNRYSFKYGRVDVKAKLPSGDWLFPEIYLEPKTNRYGNGYQSGRIVLALIRANDLLRDKSTNEEIGSRLLSVGCLYRAHDDFSENLQKYINTVNEVGWNGDFHNFSVLWTPEKIEFFVDQKSLGKCKLPNSGNKRYAPWKNGSSSAPFDEEFYVSIGLGAGGIREFPKTAITGTDHPKPWKNTGNKDVLTFWQDKDNWYKTWNENSHLQIDDVKVYAL